jgi:16S rRNA (cytosine967-C5)-methyltransferase
VGHRLVKASHGRRVALAVVSRVREREAYAHETLDKVLREHNGLDSRDAALATRLAYGTISCRGTLDEAVARFLERPGRLEPRVGDALAMSAWELIFGGVESHVAVNEGVELVRGVRPQAAGLANAVLRRLADAASTFPWGEPETDTAALARQYGHPLWMTERLIDDLGPEVAEAVLAADGEPAPLYVAQLPFTRPIDETMARLEAGGARPQEGPVLGSIELRNPSALATDDEGRSPKDFLVCDAAAQFAVGALDARPGMRIVEVGAGRGTKSIIAQANALRAGGLAEMWAVDSHEFKLRVLADTVARFGLDNTIHPVLADATDMSSAADLPAAGTADAVLVDAPCSGLGTLRRHPDKRWRLSPGDIGTLALLGTRLLGQASRLVRPGGFVVYSTCTLTRAENNDVIADFLGREEGRYFAIDDLSSEVPSVWSDFATEQGWFQSVPRIGGPDGHFVARLRRA